MRRNIWYNIGMNLKVVVFRLLCVAAGAAVAHEPQAVQFPLGAVTLNGGPMLARRNIDEKYLLDIVDADRLLAGFREIAGLPQKAARYPNRWEGGQINGHSLGHFLSAGSALHAVAGDADTKARAKAKADYIVSELGECQKANGNGFLMTCPQKIYELVRSGRFRAGKFDINKWWVPNYTLHKIFAGLRDAYRWTGNEEALETERRLGDWYIGVVQGLDDDKLQRLLVSEWGGLNETFADLYDDTHDARYRDAAEKYFDDRKVFEPLKAGMDNLDGKHANTQIPKMAGLARLYEQTGKEEYRAAVETFWCSITERRSFANGGHSDDEHFFPTKDNAAKLGPHNNETCNVHNMLRLAAHVFGWNPDAKHMDFVERALYNQILAQIGRAPGEFGYFLSQAPVGEKVWSTPEGAWWCCVGTGMENPMHYTDHIYYKDRNNEVLYVNLFVSATLRWEEKGIEVVQKTDFPCNGEVTLKVAGMKDSGRWTMKIHAPYWCLDPAVAVNGEAQTIVKGEDGYIAIDRSWQDGDTVALSLPMRMHANFLPETDGTLVAFMYGPLVLAGITPAQDGMADNAKRRWDDHLAAPGKTGEAAATVVTDNMEAALETFSRKSGTMNFTAKGLLRPVDRDFMPLMDVYEEHYTVYFPVLEPHAWEKDAEKLAAEHSMKAVEEARLVDEVFPGFQQSEINHDIEAEFSDTGEADGFKFRIATCVQGCFEYTLAVDGASGNELVVRYLGEGREWGYDILADGIVLACTGGCELKQENVVEKVYALPPAATDGRKSVRIAISGKIANAAGICYVAVRRIAAKSVDKVD